MKTVQLQADVEQTAVIDELGGYRGGDRGEGDWDLQKAESAVTNMTCNELQSYSVTCWSLSEKSEWLFAAM